MINSKKIENAKVDFVNCCLECRNLYISTEEVQCARCECCFEFIKNDKITIYEILMEASAFYRVPINHFRHKGKRFSKRFKLYYKICSECAEKLDD